MLKHKLALTMATFLLALAGRVDAGHVAACLASAIPNSLRGCPVSADVTYFNVKVGSFDQCVRHVRLTSTDPSVVILPIPPNPLPIGPVPSTAKP